MHVLKKEDPKITLNMEPALKSLKNKLRICEQRQQRLGLNLRNRVGCA